MLTTKPITTENYHCLLESWFPIAIDSYGVEKDEQSKNNMNRWKRRLPTVQYFHPWIPNILPTDATSLLCCPYIGWYRNSITTEVVMIRSEDRKKMYSPHWEPVPNLPVHSRTEYTRCSGDPENSNIHQQIINAFPDPCDEMNIPKDCFTLILEYLQTQVFPELRIHVFDRFQQTRGYSRLTSSMLVPTVWRKSNHIIDHSQMRLAPSPTSAPLPIFSHFLISSTFQSYYSAWNQALPFLYLELICPHVKLAEGRQNFQFQYKHRHDNGSESRSADPNTHVIPILWKSVAHFYPCPYQCPASQFHLSSSDSMHSSFVKVRRQWNDNREMTTDHIYLDDLCIEFDS